MPSGLRQRVRHIATAGGGVYASKQAQTKLLERVSEKSVCMCTKDILRMISDLI